MENFVMPAPVPASLAVAHSLARFPLRRVFCVGRNYAAHAREMGNDPDREPPFFFMKPADAVTPAEGRVPYPPLTEDLHHEVELVVAVGKRGFRLSANESRELVWGYGVGVDLTRRDLQKLAKEQSRPWDWAKGFDASGPCGPILPVNHEKIVRQGRIWLEVNGQVRQDGNINEMIWPVEDVLAYLSQSVVLRPGDLVFTGTPAGVGRLLPGDKVRAGVDGVGEIAFEVGPIPSTP